MTDRCAMIGGGGGVSDFDDFVGLVHHSIGCWDRLLRLLLCAR